MKNFIENVQRRMDFEGACFIFDCESRMEYRILAI